jgi:farnesyl-diphosphate farnesyltransferase
MQMKHQYQMLRRVSRTFALSIEQLPRGLRDTLTLAYLLLRVSDGLEDYGSIPAARKAELLRLWERILADAEPPHRLVAAITDLDPAEPEIQVALGCGELLLQMHRLPEPVRIGVLGYVRQTTLGMARWQSQGPVVATEPELDDYMHQVAGIVGYLITDAFAYYEPAIRERRGALMPLGREFGLGLQTVNVIRGLRSDWERGWVFVPRSFYEPLGLRAGELFEPANEDRAMQVVDRLVAKADRHLWFGMSYILTLPRRLHRVRLMCIWPLLLAARTLAVSRGNPAVLRSEAKIGRDEVRAIMRKSALLGWSNAWLERYYNRLNPGSVWPRGAAGPEGGVEESLALSPLPG